MVSSLDLVRPLSGNRLTIVGDSISNFIVRYITAHKATNWGFKVLVLEKDYHLHFPTIIPINLFIGSRKELGLVS